MAFNPLDYLKNLVPENTNIFGASPNANMEKMAKMGLLGDANYKDMLAKANKQSIFQGLLSSGLAYAAQPKNQGYGSIFPYLAKAGLAGVQAAQSPYDQMGQDAMMNQKLQEMKRANDLRIAEEDFRKGVLPPQGSSVVNPNAQVRLALDYNKTNQDYGVGSSLMGGRNAPTTLNPVSPNFGLKSVNAPLAQTLGVSEAQLPKTTSTVDPEEVNLYKRYASGLSTYEQYMAARKDLLDSKKLQYIEEDPTKRLVAVDPITKQRTTIREGVPTDDGIKITNDRDAIANTYKGQTNSDTGVTYGDKVLFADLSRTDQAKVLDKTKQDEIDIAVQTEIAKDTSPTGLFNNAVEMGARYTQDIKNGAFDEFEQNFQKIEASLALGTPISDVAAATQIMKLLDPRSVVRDSELRVAMNANSLDDRIVNWYARAIEGKILTPEQRKEFGDLAKEFYNVSKNARQKVDQRYIKVADKYNLDKELILGVDKVPTYNPKTGVIE
jgi:hypothetical protein